MQQQQFATAAYGAQDLQNNPAIERMFRAADLDGDGLVSIDELQKFQRYYQAVDVDGDGQISTAELKRATLAMQQQGAEQRAAFEAQQAALQHQVASGAEDLRNLMAALQVAREQGVAPKRGRRRGEPGV